jgi:hypothetical protein
MNHLIFSKRKRKKILSLCDDFKEVSKRTWNLLKNAADSNMSIGEETITDVNLLELQIRQPAAILTRQVSRYNENLIGADWIWAIVGRTGRTFILYVQAKKLFLRSDRYESLIERANRFHQVDNLIANQFFYQVLGISMYPIYVFYNYFPDRGSKIQCNCMNLIDSNLAGCSYADAIQVRNLIAGGQDTMADLYPIQYSLSCLVCCSGAGTSTKTSGGNVDLATAFFNRIVNTDTLNEFMQERNVKDFSAQSLLMSEPPTIINQVIAGRDINEKVFEDLNISKIVVLDERELHR